MNILLDNCFIMLIVSFTEFFFFAVDKGPEAVWIGCGFWWYYIGDEIIVSLIAFRAVELVPFVLSFWSPCRFTVLVSHLSACFSQGFGTVDADVFFLRLYINVLLCNHYSVGYLYRICISILVLKQIIFCWKFQVFQYIVRKHVKSCPKLR